MVVDDLHAGVVLGQQGDLVGNGLGIGEGGDILADVGEAENHSIGVGSGQLGLGLLAENDDVRVGVLLENTASSLAQTGVDTTAKTLVGAGDDQQSLLVVERLGLGLLEDGVGGLTVGTRIVHGLLGTVQTGRGDDLHGVGDLLDVLDGLQTALDFTQGREVSRVGGGSALKTGRKNCQLSLVLSSGPHLIPPSSSIFFPFSSIVGDSMGGGSNGGRRYGGRMECAEPDLPGDDSTAGPDGRTHSTREHGEIKPVKMRGKRDQRMGAGREEWW